MFFSSFFHTCTEGSDESVRAKSRTINKLNSRDVNRPRV